MDICTELTYLNSGQFFIPLTTDEAEKKRLIAAAIQKGGRILEGDLWEAAKKYRRKLTCSVMAVAGTVGKTTTVRRLSALLGQRFSVATCHKNDPAEWAIPLAILRADSTTEILILECPCDSKGAMKQLASLIRPTHVVITNTGAMQANCQTELFRPQLDWESSERVTFLNHMSPYYYRLHTKAEHQDFTVFPFEGETPLDQNLNLCEWVGRRFGLSADEITQGLLSAESNVYHPQVLTRYQATLIDDSLHCDPISVSYALSYLEKAKGRKLLVFSGMPNLGKFSKKQHLNVLDQALDVDVSVMFTVGEETQDLVSDAISLTHFEDKSALTETLLMEIKPGDVILIKAAPEHGFSDLIGRLKQS